jgi:ubiquinone/menaquinone biosynthesis C-methylase UbiE
VRSAFRRIAEVAITGPGFGAGVGSIRTALDLGDFEVDTTSVYSSKATKYAKYRWDYSPCAIQTICDVASLSAESVVADIGAGTGILARHFVDAAGRVFAVEPNAEMRRVAAQSLAQHPSCHVINGRAEATTLSDCSIDLITVAQAIHWFEPEPARSEFLRIIKPQGWLAVLRNNGTDTALNAAIENAVVREHGIDTSSRECLPGKEPTRFYFGSDAFQRSN